MSEPTKKTQFSISCHHCRAVVLNGVSRIDEDGVTFLRAHVLRCRKGPFADTAAAAESSLVAERLRELGVLLKHFKVTA